MTVDGHEAWHECPHRDDDSVTGCCRSTTGDCPDLRGEHQPSVEAADSGHSTAHVREVTQSITYSPEREAEGIYGNCLQAAVAALFDKPLDAVPHFSAFLWWPDALSLWAKGEGYAVEGERTDTIPDRLCIVGGKSERGVPHVCVAEGGRIVWDPHPSRSGLVSITDATWFVEDEEFMRWKRWSDGQRRDDSAEVESSWTEEAR